MENQDTVNQFIINATLVDPIQKIIAQLNNGEFRDCDIKWLDNKMDKFVDFAAKTFGIHGIMPQPESVKPAYMNEYAVNYYSNYFTKLLEYFKSF